MRKLVQAKHIDDAMVLGNVDELSRISRPYWPLKDGETRWVFVDEMQFVLPMYPPKVVVAKLASLIRRKLLDGCACGCRGDFVVTEAGRARLGRPA